MGTTPEAWNEFLDFMVLNLEREIEQLEKAKPRGRAPRCPLKRHIRDMRFSAKKETRRAYLRRRMKFFIEQMVYDDTE
jgi:hypothetical protein